MRGWAGFDRKSVLVDIKKCPADTLTCAPRVNIQTNKGMAKAYQVRQVIKAIERMEARE